MSTNSSTQLNGPAYSVFDTEVPTGPVTLQARLSAPATSRGWVIIGYSRHFRHFALSDNLFGRAGLATMHLQLHLPQEPTPLLDSDILNHLTQQLIGATEWLQSSFDSPKPIGLFGAYQDAGVALSAAAFLGSDVGAVASWQGRPDESMNHLSAITAPTLLLVNEGDLSIFAANVQTRWWLRCVHQLSLIPGRLCLLRERSSFELVNQLTRDWYRRHLLGRQPLKDLPGQLFIPPSNAYEWSGQHQTVQ